MQGGGPRPAPEPGRLLVEVPQVARPQEEVEEAEQHRAGGPAETACGPLAVLNLCIGGVNVTVPGGERLSPTCTSSECGKVAVTAAWSVSSR